MDLLMPTENLQIISYMVPVDFGDGKGFRTHVSPEPGCWLLISEINRSDGRIDETLVFLADEEGGVTNLAEMFRAASTHDALQRIKDDWSVEEHNNRLLGL
jgi:hypothetical protein